MSRERTYDAEIICGELTIKNVPCEINFPDVTRESIKIKIESTDKDLYILSTKSYFSLKADVYNVAQEKTASIEAVRISINSYETLFDGKKNTFFIEGAPDELSIIHFKRKHKFPSDILDGNKESKTKKYPKLAFIIDRVPIITPFSLPRINHFGEVLIESESPLNVNISDEFQIEFQQFYTAESNSSKIELRPYLVVSINADALTSSEFILKKEFFYNKLEDVLHLVSFVQNEKVNWLQWSFEDDDVIIVTYRGNVRPLKELKADSKLHWIIGKSDVCAFIETAFYNFHNGSYKTPLIGAIYTLNSGNGMPVETYFMALFQSLESIVGINKKMSDTEFVLSQSEWRVLRKNIEVAIKSSSDVNMSKDDRRKMYNKLNELNRVSFKDAYLSFSKDFEFHTISPWSLFDEDGCVGLTSIRNMLAHGDSFPSDITMPLFVAGECLALLLQELIFNVVGWKTYDTNRNIYNSPRLKFDRGFIQDCKQKFKCYYDLLNK
ncbi:TPA: hypothetical protein LLS51_000037 [Serratia marcescens]|nr:hypothetical protein [Serratia marcescens]HBK4670721.1 hypothetical protein [Serratia marcescens]